MNIISRYLNLNLNLSADEQSRINYLVFEETVNAFMRYGLPFCVCVCVCVEI